MIFLVEEVCPSKRIEPWACFGTLRPYRSSSIAPVYCLLRSESVIFSRSYPTVKTIWSVTKPCSTKSKEECIRHFPKDNFCLLCLIGTLQDLPGTETICAWLIGFDRRNGTGFPSPGVVDEQLCIFPKEMIEQFLIFLRTQRHISHCKHTMCF